MSKSRIPTLYYKVTTREKGKDDRMEFKTTAEIQSIQR